MLYELFTPLFDRLLRRLDVTVWVSAADILGLAALFYLREHGIAVPGRLSVASFDDSPEAMLYGLTSYNFKGEEYVRAMLDFVLHPSAPRHRGICGPIEIPGSVSEHGSTGPPTSCP